MEKVFISYSHKDKAFAEKLNNRLKQKDFNIFFDEDAIDVGAHISLSIEEALEKADYVLILMSQAYFESDWTRFEAIFHMIDDPLNKQGVIKPLLLEKCDIPKRLKSFRYLDLSTDDLFEKNFPTLCESMAAHEISHKENEKKDPIVHLKIQSGRKDPIIDFYQKLELSLANRTIRLQLSLTMGTDDNNEFQDAIECQQLQLISGQYSNKTITIPYSDHQSLKAILNYFKLEGCYSAVLTNHDNCWQVVDKTPDIQEEAVVINDVDHKAFFWIIGDYEKKWKKSLAHIQAALNNQTDLNTQDISITTIVFAVNMG